MITSSFSQIDSVGPSSLAHKRNLRSHLLNYYRPFIDERNELVATFERTGAVDDTCLREFNKKWAVDLTVLLENPGYLDMVGYYRAFGTFTGYEDAKISWDNSPPEFPFIAVTDAKYPVPFIYPDGGQVDLPRGLSYAVIPLNMSRAEAISFLDRWGIRKKKEGWDLNLTDEIAIAEAEYILKYRFVDGLPPKAIAVKLLGPNAVADAIESKRVTIHKLLKKLSRLLSPTA